MVEMLISILVASILMLTIGVLSSVATGTSTQLRREAEIFNEIMYAYKFIQKHVREASSCGQVTATSPWVNDKLSCPQTSGVPGVAFGVYLNGSTRQLVFLKDKNDDNVREVLFEVPDDPSGPDLDMTLIILNSDFVEVRIIGEKSDIPFNLVSKAKPRG